ncbi:glycosyltransferase family 2 protein [Psychroserpens sp. Hel_I_66]|uniref:glycosyltransferase family 2 protein n=1 Tax=Psychroserpens sp. Hel_I_66 TaxID=1250004 RepID=UPI000648FCD7|nr:glycosyltransferase family 2 protein [Psychroserpens sp. Hel_I_66]
MKKRSSSLIISTYNWPEALGLVLESLKNQTVLPDEVLIADDGSTAETKNLITKISEDIKIPIHHIWHEDVGFTKATILNKAIARAQGEYIVQVDGDCIMHPNFVKDHLMFSSENCYLYGSRVNIQKAHLDTLFKDQQIQFGPFSEGIKKRTRAIYSPFLGQFYKANHQFSKKFRGCNTSYFKSDFVAINGYNEDFKGWGREDSELALRFHNNGLKSRRLRYRGIVYHIFHIEKSKSRLELNNDIELRTINEKLSWTENGIDKYLKVL